MPVDGHVTTGQHLLRYAWIMQMLATAEVHYAYVRPGLLQIFQRPCQRIKSAPRPMSGPRRLR